MNLLPSINVPGANDTSWDTSSDKPRNGVSDAFGSFSTIALALDLSTVLLWVKTRTPPPSTRFSEKATGMSLNNLLGVYCAIFAIWIFVDTFGLAGFLSESTFFCRGCVRFLVNFLVLLEELGWLFGNGIEELEERGSSAHRETVRDRYRRCITVNLKRWRAEAPLQVVYLSSFIGNYPIYLWRVTKHWLENRVAWLWLDNVDNHLILQIVKEFGVSS